MESSPVGLDSLLAFVDPVISCDKRTLVLYRDPRYSHGSVSRHLNGTESATLKTLDTQLRRPVCTVCQYWKKTFIDTVRTSWRIIAYRLLAGRSDHSTKT